jgi:hypothetical protein
VMASYVELCDRYEANLKKSNRDGSKKNVQQESLQDLEKKSNFALHCLLREAMIVKAYSSTLPKIVSKLYETKKDSHQQLAILYG